MISSIALLDFRDLIMNWKEIQPSNDMNSENRIDRNLKSFNTYNFSISIRNSYGIIYIDSIHLSSKESSEILWEHTFDKLVIFDFNDPDRNHTEIEECTEECKSLLIKTLLNYKYREILDVVDL